MRRFWIPLLIVVLSLGGVAVAADAFVVTQREQLDGFVDDATREPLEGRLDGVLGHIDPDVVACKLQQSGQIREFGSGERAELADAVRAALNVFDGHEQRLLQHAERIDGDRARVTARMADSGYEQTVIYDLVRRDERWFVRTLRIL